MNKNDLLKVLEMKFVTKLSTIKNKYSLEESNIRNLITKNKVTVKVAGYTVKTRIGYSYEITDKKYLKLREQAKKEDELNSVKRQEIRNKYNEVKENILLFGATQELAEMIQNF